jgi:DNA-binding NarL/FixJ family response regulator
MSAAFSPREAQIATLVSKGLSNREIAESLQLSVGTIKLHVHHILLKAGAQNRRQIKSVKKRNIAGVAPAQ